MCGRLRPSRIELLDGERFVGVGRKCYLSNKDAVKKKNKRKNMPIKKLSMVEMICFVFFFHSWFHKLLQLFYRSTYSHVRSILCCAAGFIYMKLKQSYQC